MKKHVSDLKGKLSESLKAGEGSIKQNWEGSKGELLKVFHTWESTSQVWVKEFINLFDANGPVVSLYSMHQQGPDAFILFMLVLVLVHYIG